MFVLMHRVNGAALGSPYQPPVYSGPEPSAELDNAKLYHGSCHCGAIPVAFKTPLLDKDYPGTVIECNCSICNRVSELNPPFLSSPPTTVDLAGIERLRLGLPQQRTSRHPRRGRQHWQILLRH